EDGIRDFHVTGVQTCALPISLIQSSDFQVERLGSTVSYAELHATLLERVQESGVTVLHGPPAQVAGQDGQAVVVRQGDSDLRCEIGRASCRERGEETVAGGR